LLPHLVGGVPPLAIAAAFGRDDFESGSDSKSLWVQIALLFPIFRKLHRLAKQFAGGYRVCLD